MTTKELQQQALATLKHYDGGKYHSYLLNNVLSAEQRATFLASRPNPEFDRYFATATPPEPLVGTDRLFGQRRSRETKPDPYVAAAKLVMSRQVEHEPDPERPIEVAPELRTSRFQEEKNPEFDYLYGIMAPETSKPVAVKPSPEFDRFFQTLSPKKDT